MALPLILVIPAGIIAGIIHAGIAHLGARRGVYTARRDFEAEVGHDVYVGAMRQRGIDPYGPFLWDRKVK